MLSDLLSGASAYMAIFRPMEGLRRPGQKVCNTFINPLSTQ